MTEPVATPAKSPYRGSPADINFVTRIHRRVREDGATRSALRSGLRRTADASVRSHPYVVPWLSERALDSRYAVEPYYAVASWVAAYAATSIQPGQAGVSLGAAARRAARHGDDPLRKRLTDLGRCSQHLLLTNRLPSLLDLLASRHQLPDLALLLTHLRTWPHDSGRVFRGWMNDLYRSPAQKPSSDLPNESDAS